MIALYVMPAISDDLVLLSLSKWYPASSYCSMRACCDARMKKKTQTTFRNRLSGSVLSKLKEDCFNSKRN